MNRRDALQCMAAAAAAMHIAASDRADAAEPKREGLGLVSYCLNHHQRALRLQAPPIDLADPAEFLDFCHKLGGAGVQVAMPKYDEARAKALRARSSATACIWRAWPTFRPMGPISTASRPRSASRQPRGSRSCAVSLPGRRYEYFDSLEQFRRFEQRARQSLQLAVPVVEKHHVRLAVENHKTYLAAEQVDLLRRIGSAYVGSCVDIGNNLAFLEDPLEVVQALAPTAFSVHLKDLAVQEYADGFLVANAPLGRARWTCAARWPFSARRSRTYGSTWR